MHRSSSPSPIPETFALGVCDYPEHVPWDQWKHYPARQREMGLTYVRIAEFAWSRIEPVPGEFEWQWLDGAVEALHAEGLKVVMCTPTATPPAWLIRKHPEILLHGQSGPCARVWLAQTLRPRQPDLSRAFPPHHHRDRERYGQHPAVAGWQTDNEWGCHSSTRSYGGASVPAFQAWLQRRYGTVEALNQAWGNVFWSQEYNDWSQIEPPHLTVADPNPSHVLDFYRFASDAVAEFQARSGPHPAGALPRPLDYAQLHDALPRVRSLHRTANRSISRRGIPIRLGQSSAGRSSDEEKVRWARTGHPDVISFNHDLYRGLKGRRAFWVMEQGNGQVNWAPSNAAPADGAVALWTAQA